MRRIALFCMCIIVILSGCASADEEIPALLEPVGIKVDTAVVTRGEIYNIFIYDAAVVAPVETLYFTANGTVGTFDVAVGRTVRAGEVLATLDQTSVEEQIVSLNEAIRFREQTLAYQAAIGDVDIRTKKLALEKLQNAPLHTESNASRQRKIDLLKIDIEEIKLSLKQNNDIARQIELKHMYGELQKLRETAGMGKIIASRSGHIVYKEPLNGGDAVKAFDPLIYVAADDGFTVESAYISDSLVGRAHEVYALVSGEKYPLAYIPTEQSEYLAALNTGATLISKFAIDVPHAALSKLSPGMYAAVCVITDYAADTLTIPANAVYRDGDMRYVYIMQEDARIWREVKTGVTSNNLTQILSGLDEGETVFVKD